MTQNKEYGYVPATFLRRKVFHEFSDNIITDDMGDKEEEDCANEEDNCENEENYLPENSDDSKEDDGEEESAHTHLHHLNSLEMSNCSKMLDETSGWMSRYNKQQSGLVNRGDGVKRLIANKRRKDYFHSRCEAIKEYDTRERSNSFDASVIKNPQLKNLLSKKDSGSEDNLIRRNGRSPSITSLGDRIRSMQTSQSMSVIPISCQDKLNRSGSLSSSSGSSLASDFAPLARVQTEYISTRSYSAQRPDELSFPQDSVISVTKKNNDGWWNARLVELYSVIKKISYE